MKKKPEVIHEEIKDRHTSHWDLDLLSREELERLMTVRPAPAATPVLPQSPGKPAGTDPEPDA
ncbi:MAG: hypothetical protein RLZZ385_1190 [Pseudomonadota bacterium]|jgi:hypothetical protein